MAERVVTAHIVVNFQPVDNEILQVEIDDRPDGLNNGDTQFSPGDEVGFLVFKSANVNITSVISSAGTIASAGSQTKEVEELLVFPKERRATVRYPLNSSFSGTWLGNNLGGYTTDETTVTLNTQTPGVGALWFEYTSRADGYKLRNTPAQLGGKKDYSIVIFVAGEVV